MKVSAVVVFMFCLSLTATSYAQSGDERQIAAAVETLKKGMLEGNKSVLESITASELSYGHSNGLMEDKASFVGALASGKSDFLTINLSDQTIKIVGNTALVRHRLSGTNKDSGKEAPVNIGILLVWQKQQGKWKLLARQAYKIL
ncbi:MAG: nuclear transport factor 2 family protein [Chitinophagaceae bacterium]